ncbi:hypothetical protein NUH88_18390 [Nisaea acidiphila]|uniref:Uncharacterized protein n=1 Tax=Nisaea acidiphila TaxID=1862145 RepID=A0A9J7ASN9_9PROT|nr:hypothetical protein [Nisaea acidiphila]UUX49356.1 hypothetical protein NUH88_18390 [Nisaea acidiphila]
MDLTRVTKDGIEDGAIDSSKLDTDISVSNLTASEFEISNQTEARAIVNDANGTVGGSIHSVVDFAANGTRHGKVGFETSGGTMALQNDQGHIYLNADTNNAHANSSIIFTVDNAEKMRTGPEGLVLGTSTGYHELTAYGGYSCALQVTNANSGIGSDAGGYFAVVGTSDLRVWNFSDSSILFGTNNSQAASLSNTGDFVAEGTGITKKGRPIISDSSTGRTLSVSDNGSYIRFSNASPVTVTVPGNSTEAIPVGAEISLFQSGTGTVTVSASGGVTVNSLNSHTQLSGTFAAATLKKVGTDEWDLCGDLTA